jgi:hypothetical protein
MFRNMTARIQLQLHCRAAVECTDHKLLCNSFAKHLQHNRPKAVAHPRHLKTPASACTELLTSPRAQPVQDNVEANNRQHKRSPSWPAHHWHCEECYNSTKQRPNQTKANSCVGEIISQVLKCTKWFKGSAYKQLPCALCVQMHTALPATHSTNQGALLVHCFQ